MDSQRHAIVYTTNELFWEHLYVSLYSLLVNNSELKFDVYVMAVAPDARFLANVAHLRRIHPDHTVSWLPVEADMFEGVPLSHYSKANYYKLLIGSLMPEGLQRALYLDADTIVRGPLDELLSVDTEQHVLAATPDDGVPQSSHRNRLGSPEVALYFNTGVLLINLELWRKRAVEERSMTLMDEYRTQGRELKYVDQDVLNIVLTGQWRIISPIRYNFKWNTGTQEIDGFIDDGKAGGAHIQSSPTILHYANYKPWNSRCRHPFWRDYWHYRMQTPYADPAAFRRVRIERGARVIQNRILSLPFGNYISRGARVFARAAGLR